MWARVRCREKWIRKYPLMPLTNKLISKAKSIKSKRPAKLQADILFPNFKKCLYY
jgi:hypothetical protein